MVIVADGATKVSMHVAGSKFRKVPVPPALDIQLAREKRCERSAGHILVVRHNLIVCERCDAQWKDEGF
jgi:hypothetical protein